MKILAPINSLELIPFYAKIWIKEVYGWFIDTAVQQKLPSMWILNGRPTPKANFENIKVFQQAIDMCKEHGIKFHVTFNLLPYLWDDKLLQLSIENLRSLNFESIILSDINLFQYFNDKEIVVSTLSSVYNSQHISELLSSYNIKKIVLPRELSIKEQLHLIKKFLNIDFELLVLNDWCYNNDGMCSSVHFKYLPKDVSHSCKRDSEFKIDGAPDISEKLQKLTVNRWDCKTCMIYFFKDYLDRVSFKIAGRAKGVSNIKKDILYATQVYKQLFHWYDYNSYNTANIKIFEQIYKKPCSFENCEMYNYYRK